MGFGWCSTPVDLSLFYIPFKGKERRAKTKLLPAKLRAVLACAVSDSAQCFLKTECQKYMFYSFI